MAAHKVKRNSILTKIMNLREKKSSRDSSESTEESVEGGNQEPTNNKSLHFPNLEQIGEDISDVLREIQTQTKSDYEIHEESMSDEDEEVTELDKKIIRQVEFYFGDFNLPKDRFMLELMAEDEGWITMDMMMTFKRLANLSQDPNQVLKSLAKSNSGLMQIHFDKMKIRRNPELYFPKMDEARRLSLQDRTVFVAGFDKEKTTLDDLIDFFEKGFEKVGNIRMRTSQQQLRHPSAEDQRESKDKQPELENPRFLGSTFVTFATRQAAQDFINKCMKKEVSFRGRRLFGKWQKDFFNEKTITNDTFNPDTISKTVFVHGFDKLDTSGEELAEFFGEFSGASTVRKRVFRDRKENYADGEEELDWKFTGSAFVTFETEKLAEKFLQIKNLNYKGDALSCKWQKDFYLSKGKFQRQLKELND